MRLVLRLGLSVVALTLCLPLLGQDVQPKPDASKLPGVKVDVKAKQVRVDCQAINANMPLEFFCVMSGTAEHESVLRTDAKPSHVHLGLLMLGLTPGEPVKYSEAAQKWIAPQGPPIHINCEWQGKDGPDAARRASDCLGEEAVAWRHPRVDFIPGVHHSQIIG